MPSHPHLLFRNLYKWMLLLNKQCPLIKSLTFFIHIILKLLVDVDNAEDSSSCGKAGPSMSHCVKFLQGLRSATSTVTNDQKDLSNSDISHRSGHRQNFPPFRLRACPIIFSILLVTRFPPLASDTHSTAAYPRRNKLPDLPPNQWNLAPIPSQSSR
jgi:hypothetical protein